MKSIISGSIVLLIIEKMWKYHKIHRHRISVQKDSALLKSTGLIKSEEE